MYIYIYNIFSTGEFEERGREGGGLAPMIAVENQPSLRAGSSLGQVEEAAGEGGGGNEAGGPATSPGEGSSFLPKELILLHPLTLSENH